ncbi:MAG: VWA domain-containing protein [Desulfobacteraceae bacterium]|nr:MAG: VWA domain-containing protein [Desulfobacteraceae bacterium]
MSLTFISSVLLSGVAAVILPILIHRITKRRTVVRAFSAVYLLLQSQPVAVRPRRIKHLMLLILRVLAVASIALMMAQPVFVRAGFGTLLKDGAQVLILDNSLSMSFSEDRGRRFDMAKKAAREALEGFRGQVAVIATAENRRGNPSDLLWMRPESALSRLESIPLSFGGSRTVDAFTSAFRLLKDLEVPGRILVISDMTRNDWAKFNLSDFETVPDAEVIFLRIGPAARDANFSVKQVRLETGGIIAGVTERLEVSVSNLSDLAGSRIVEAHLSGTKTDQKSITLEAGREGQVSFDLRIDDPGWIEGEIRLSSDRLSYDDIHYFPLKVRERIDVLIVDGNPGTSLRSGESYYLASALRPAALQASAFLPEIITESEFSRMDPHAYDALFVLNVARPDPYRLASFLDAGKPVFLFLGDRIDPSAYNRLPFSPFRILGRIEPIETVGKATRIDRFDDEFKFLQGIIESLKKASFGAYFKIEGASNPILTLENEDPLLAEAQVGESRMFVFSSSADLDWNDLPLTAAYLPLVRGMVKEGGGSAGTSLPEGIRIGDPAGEKLKGRQVKGPPGGPGLYRVDAGAGEMQGVNPPYEESDLTKIDPDSLEKKLATVHATVLEYREGDLEKRQGGRKPLWPYLLAFLLAVLAVETVIANDLIGGRK